MGKWQQLVVKQMQILNLLGVTVNEAIARNYSSFAPTITHNYNTGTKQ